MREAARLSIRVLLGLTTVAVVGALLLAWRLGSHPIDLDQFVPMAERALSPSNGDATVQVRQMSLAREGGGLVVRIKDVRAVGGQGAELLSVPSARVYLSVKALLADGVLAPSRIAVEGLGLSMTILANDELAVGIQADDPLAAPGAPANGASAAEVAEGAEAKAFDPAGLLALWENDVRLRHLRQIDLEYGNISVADIAHGLAWRAPNVSASIVQVDDGVVFRGDGLMRQLMLRGEEIDRALGGIHWEVQVHQPHGGTGGKDESGPEVSVEVTLDQVDPTILTGIVPPLVGKRGLEAPISGTLTASFPLGQWPNSAELALTLDEGQISIPNKGALAFDKVTLIGRLSLADISMHLDELVLTYGGMNARSQLRLSGDARLGPDDEILVTAAVKGIVPAWLATLSPAFSQMDGVDVVLSGETQLVFDRKGDLRDGALQLAGARAAINMPGVFEQPVALAGLEAAVRLEDYGTQWVLDRLGLYFEDGGIVEVTGLAQRGKGSGVAEFAVTGKDFDVDTVKRFWPLPISPPAREWVVQNIKSGKVPSLKASLAADIGAVGTPLELSNLAVEASLPVRNVTLSYWGPLPIATEVDAEARITQSLFEAKILKGKTGGMDVTGGNIVVSGIDKGKGHELLDLSVDAVGPLAELMEILDRKPLHFARFLKMKPSTLRGTVSGRLDIVLPPIAELSLDDVEINASGRSYKAMLPGVAGGHDLQQADLNFTVDKQDLRLKGKARIAGTPVTLSAHMPYSDKAPYRGRYVLVGGLDNRARARFGLDNPAFQPPVMDGPASIVLTATQLTGNKTVLDLDLDLSKTTLKAVPVGWAKPKGSFAAGKVRLVVENEALRAVESFQLSGPGMRIAGNAQFARGSGRPTVRFAQLKLGGGTDIRLTVRPLPKEGYEVEFGKGRLDLRPLILANKADTGGRSKDEPKAPFQITVNGSDVRVRAGPPFQNMRGGILLHGDRIMNAEIRGKPGGVGTALFRMTPAGDLRVTASDAGALLRTLGIPGRLAGGTLKLTGTAAADLSTIDADMRVAEFKLVEAPVMMRVLQLASITGPLELLAGSKGLTMTALEAPFTLKNKKLTIKDGRVYGGSLGVTFRGNMDLPSESLDFRGAVVPVYVLNRLLSSVPLVGDVLTGGEGVFAVSYSISGKYSDPKVSVNPLSLLAPGGLRRLLLD